MQRRRMILNSPLRSSMCKETKMEAHFMQVDSPDHALLPGSKWELIQYFTDRFHAIFS